MIVNWIAHFSMAVVFIAVAMQQVPAQPLLEPQTRIYFRSFLDRPPTAAERAILPPEARDVIVAKVRVVTRPIYLIGRQPPGAPARLPSDLFQVRLEIVDVLEGRSEAGTKYDVYFGIPGFGVNHSYNYEYPRTRSQMTREYFVISYLNSDGRRRLLALPIDAHEFEKWEREAL